MYHFLCDCSHSNSFWKDVESYYFSLSQEQVQLSLKDILHGILTTERPLGTCQKLAGGRGGGGDFK